MNSLPINWNLGARPSGRSSGGTSTPLDRWRAPSTGSGVCGLKSALVRLRAHLDSGVKVPDLADTEGPVTESNCIGAITPGGEQLEVNDQSVTPGLQAEVQSELDSVGGFGEPASVKAKPKRNSAASAEGVDAAGREPQMVGD